MTDHTDTIDTAEDAARTQQIIDLRLFAERLSDALEEVAAGLSAISIVTAMDGNTNGALTFVINNTGRCLTDATDLVSALHAAVNADKAAWDPQLWTNGTATDLLERANQTGKLTGTND